MRAMKRALGLAATALLSACPSPRVPRPIDDAALRVRVAQAEARRGAGIAELVALAHGDDPHARALALRGLGRIGGPAALAAIEPAVRDPDPSVAAAAWDAIAVAGALDGPDDALAAWCRNDRSVPATPAVAVARLAAFGTAGDASVDQPLDTALASRDPEVAAAAALALGRHGKRGIAVADPEVTALVAASSATDSRVRYAATWALAQAKTGAETDPMQVALAARVTDADPAIRAVAIAGLAKHGDVGAAHAAIARALRDPDWRVVVEAVRALAGPHGDDAGRDVVATELVRRWDALAAGDGAQAQVLTEGLRALAAYGARPVVSTALGALATDAAADDRVPPIARGWVACLATEGLVRAQAQPDLAALASCGGGALPDAERLPLVADLVTAGAGDAAFRRAALHLLLSNGNARVRAAGLGALAATWHDGDAADQHALVETLASALGSPDPVIAGAAVDAASGLYAAIGADPDARGPLDAAVVARAAAEREPELASDLYALIGAQVIAAGADACRAGLAAEPVRARAAAACLRALGEAAPAPPIGPATPPPVDVASVIGHDVRWHLATTRGDLDIQLRPDVAPWNVAAIVALTRRGFYDGLDVHRVVPDFVVQGGDPTMSGWGGPGFVTPAEPAGTADAAPFDAGAVGMADAGRDSAGSQWFVMQARAPHLALRYTWVGRVVGGATVADHLLIGDRVLHATVDVK
jgi:cyclophilin family peptidyl-prolyl cis-trans isomerase/HEAT repeat protein